MSESFNEPMENGEYDPDIITLSDDNGKEYSFEVLDQIEYNDERYLALLPQHDTPEEMLSDSGELVVLKVIMDGDEETFGEIEDDDEYEDVAGIFVDRLQDLFEIEDE